MDMSTDVGELAKALAAAQGEITAASKDKKNPHFNSRYADLASVWEACRGPLTKHGLSVVQMPLTDGERIGVSTTLLHASGQWIRGALWGKPEKPGPQAMVSCVTYFRRTALAAVAGVAPDDDDGEAATGRGAEGKADRVGASTETRSPAPAAVKASEIRHDGRLLSEAQLRKLHATRREAGGVYCSDEGDERSEWRMKVLAVYRDQKGERITSSKQLSSAQASHLIERMLAHIAKTTARAEQAPDIGAINRPSNGNGSDALASQIKAKGLTDVDVSEYVLAPFGADTIDQLEEEDKPKALSLLLAFTQGKEPYCAVMAKLGFSTEHLQ